MGSVHSAEKRGEGVEGSEAGGGGMRTAHRMEGAGVPTQAEAGILHARGTDRVVEVAPPVCGEADQDVWGGTMVGDYTTTSKGNTATACSEVGRLGG